jgi:hypothetical protein
LPSLCLYLKEAYMTPPEGVDHTLKYTGAPVHHVSDKLMTMLKANFRLVFGFETKPAARPDFFPNHARSHWFSRLEHF